MTKRMMGVVLILAVGLIGLMGIGRQARAAEAIVFNLANKTGYDITKIYLAPHSSADWDTDDELLKGGSFGDGHKVEITYHMRKVAPSYDLRVSWATGDPDTQWSDLHLQNGGNYALHYDKNADVTSITND